MFVHRTTRIAAVALAILASAAPAAVAKPMDPVEGYTLPHDFQSADTRDDAPSGGTYRPIPPEEQPLPRQDLRNPDTIDFANGRGVDKAPDVVVVKAPAPDVQPAGDGLDWADAGLGAGSILAVSLIALGGGLLIVQRRGGRQLAG